MIHTPQTLSKPCKFNVELHRCDENSEIRNDIANPSTDTSTGRSSQLRSFWRRWPASSSSPLDASLACLAVSSPDRLQTVSVDVLPSAALPSFSCAPCLATFERVSVQHLSKERDAVQLLAVETYAILPVEFLA